MPAPQQRTDDQWLAALRAGDAVALEQLRGWLRSGLQRALQQRSRLGEADLDDFTQEATVRVLDGLDSYRADSSFKTWSMAVAVNHALSELRRRRWRDVSLDELQAARREPAEPGPGPEHALAHGELLELLRRAMAEALTDHQRRALELLLRGLPYDVAADRLGIRKNALYKLAHDARQRLRDAFHRAGYTDEDILQRLEEARP